MSTSYKIKRWRKRTKLRVIEAMGGKCVCCGYDRCAGALSLHHLDPSQKEFRFGSVRAVAKSWEKLVQELRKCILVCSNCHAEIHDGVKEIPKNPTRFNEEYADYIGTERQKKQKSWPSCPSCHKKVHPSKKYCSTKCIKVHNKRVDWGSVDLHKMIADGLSKRKISQILGVSDKTVAKHLQS